MIIGTWFSHFIKTHQSDQVPLTRITVTILPAASIDWMMSGIWLIHHTFYTFGATVESSQPKTFSTAAENDHVLWYMDVWLVHHSVVVQCQCPVRIQSPYTNQFFSSQTESVNSALIQSEVSSGLSAVGKWGEWTQCGIAFNKPNGLGHRSPKEKNEEWERHKKKWEYRIEEHVHSDTEN